VNRLDHRSRPISGDTRGRPPEVARILPALLVGEYPRVEDVGWLRSEHGVSAVVNLQDSDDLVAKGLKVERLLEAYGHSQIEYRSVPIGDNDVERLAEALPEAVATLHSLIQAGHVALVHCNAGYNRAPTVAIAYLHTHHGLPLYEARALLRAKRPCVPYMSVLERYVSE
jgi:protein-tyrosine phosphatase